jgi:hypothetical protein
MPPPQPSTPTTAIRALPAVLTLRRRTVAPKSKSKKTKSAASSPTGNSSDSRREQFHQEYPCADYDLADNSVVTDDGKDKSHSPRISSEMALNKRDDSVSLASSNSNGWDDPHTYGGPSFDDDELSPTRSSEHDDVDVNDDDNGGHDDGSGSDHDNDDDDPSLQQAIAASTAPATGGDRDGSLTVNVVVAPRDSKDSNVPEQKRADTAVPAVAAAANLSSSSPKDINTVEPILAPITMDAAPYLRPGFVNPLSDAGFAYAQKDFEMAKTLNPNAPGLHRSQIKANWALYVNSKGELKSRIDKDQSAVIQKRSAPTDTLGIVPKPVDPWHEAQNHAKIAGRGPGGYKYGYKELDKMLSLMRPRSLGYNVILRMITGIRCSIGKVDNAKLITAMNDLLVYTCDQFAADVASTSRVAWHVVGGSEPPKEPKESEAIDQCFSMRHIRDSQMQKAAAEQNAATAKEALGGDNSKKRARDPNTHRTPDRSASSRPASSQRGNHPSGNKRTRTDGPKSPPGSNRHDGQPSAPTGTPGRGNNSRNASDSRRSSSRSQSRSRAPAASSNDSRRSSGSNRGGRGSSRGSRSHNSRGGYNKGSRPNAPNAGRSHKNGAAAKSKSATASGPNRQSGGSHQ